MAKRWFSIISATLALVLALWSNHSSAGDVVIVVIVHKQNPVGKLDKGELRPMFQTTKTQWPNGDKITPLNLPEANSLRSGVDAAVLGLKPDSVGKYWIDRKIRGGAPPPQKVPTVASMLALVASKPGAIGYVAEGDVKGNVKVVARVVNGEVK
jgi:ABC-type phosphate transport system substrate-binding protein